MSQFGYIGKLGVASMASAVSVTAAFDLKKPWATVGIGIPSMASGSDVYLLGSDDNTTFRRVFHAPTLASATPAAVTVTSGVTNCILQVGRLPVRYIKLQLSTATTDTPYTFTIYGSD
jgi:hypothetical protein